MPADRHQRGMTLVVVLLWLALLATLALGVAVATAYEPLAASAMRDRLRLRRAAESAATLAIMELSMRADWSTVPGGGVPSMFSDGAPGHRSLGTRDLDLVGETNLRTCGRPGACDDPSTSAPTADRPWAGRNPRWRPFVHLPFARISAAADRPCGCYLVAWVADDPADEDGDPATDAAVGMAGHGVVLVRGAAFDAAGGVAEVEALVAQPCRRSGANCAGIRVQSWGGVRDLNP
jgi:hypothetical protein